MQIPSIYSPLKGKPKGILMHNFSLWTLDRIFNEACDEEDQRALRMKLRRYLSHLDPQRMAPIGLCRERKKGDWFRQPSNWDRLDQREYLNRLKASYEEISDHLTLKNADAAKRTDFEREFARLLRRQTRMEVYPSLWCGSRSIDAYIACIHPFGVAFEINGKVHDEELKMKKDRFKEEMLERLMIPTANIENDDLGELTVKLIFKHIRRHKRSDFRGRERAWAKIHLETLIASGGHEHVAWVFNLRRDFLSMNLTEIPL